MNLRGRDYLLTQDFSVEEIQQLIDRSLELKRAFKDGEPHRLLADKTLFMIFFDKSTRTRNSIEAGMTQLGGHAHFIDSTTSQIAHGESPKDMGTILSTYGHGIAIRHDLVSGEGQSYMRAVAEHAKIPIVNMQCDVDHPMQTLADLMTLQEIYGQNLRGRKITVSWAYAPSYAKPMSAPQGLITLMTRFGMDVTLAHPPGYELMKDQVAIAEANAANNGSKFEIVDDMDAAFEGAHIVYPKSWGAEDFFHRPEEGLELSRKYQDWICDERRMKLADSDCKYMHCLPADRGNEVTDAVIDGSQSVVYQEAENRMHTAKAILSETM
ncbi:MAG: ornithine carbamoyltransferase [Candidatus Krumholzibacteria bacterium]|nr:ornithine carbamoyltransferase [Candidatus Krumholzibacteria bacterium]